MRTGTADFVAGAAPPVAGADFVAGAVAHKTKACYVGMTTSSSKFYLARLTKVCNVGMAPSSSKFTLKWSTKGLLPWNGTCFSASEDV